MHKIAVLMLGILLAEATCLAAETFPVAPGLKLEVNLPGQKWQISRQAPEFLFLETVEDLKHEPAAPGKEIETLKGLARLRLGANELFIFNPDSGAVLTIDFSPLRGDEKAPEERTVASSARYAGESLESEEGVEGVETKTDKVHVPGADFAHRIQASYRQRGKPVKFTGIVGFVDPYWFYLYFKDPLRNPGDAEDMRRILDSLVLKSAGGN